ncbi:FtsQ-type POTRA domain-containing protein [Conyzicola nivalis]|uniref:FtsQ-type POTRA domain-containing protein n=1 Tax=Conyzicola nivalis TaxID=1477021 RepID=UPI001E3276CA|nr:FtsQ-type POTRA domain-containing protein [Conyzicola nivalis]
MKRPEGFDPKGPDADASGKQRAPRRGAAQPPTNRQVPTKTQPPAAVQPPTPPTSPREPSTQRRPATPTTQPRQSGTAGGPRRPVLPGSVTSPPEPSTAPREPRRLFPDREPRDKREARITPEPAAKSARTPKAPKQPTAATTEREARRELARAARARRRFERGEVKRFTRRSRSRRRVWISLAGVAAVLIGVLAVAVYSPLLALRTVSVDGTARVNAQEVVDAVDSQLGTPLALIDYGDITEKLADFPLIRSYVTEMVPPDTLVIHIVERAPVAAVVNGPEFDLLDPAGVVVQSSTTRPDGVPIISIGDQGVESAAFASVIEVLLALPPELLPQVDTISATTKDNVTFSLRGVGQTVVWGSSENSAYKAKVLAAMVANEDAAAKVEYDVSAPGSVVVTPK